MTQSNTTTCTKPATCADSICSGYVDSSLQPKVGYCSCAGTKTADGGTINVYYCASTAEWPPAN